jgi:membrane protein insertase Oxa1/YidC/SpoIIIJ
MDTQGLGAKSVEERKRIMQNAMEALKKIYGRSKQRLNEINQGLYREVGTPTAGGLE